MGEVCCVSDWLVRELVLKTYSPSGCSGGSQTPGFRGPQRESVNRAQFKRHLGCIPCPRAGQG
jgi:hypothetical protein